MLGPVMLDLAGTELAREEGELLRHPAVGGVILFTRNYRDPEQLRRLIERIHALREPRLLVAADQEGGRVQRFRAGFTVLPAQARYGELYDREPHRALGLIERAGWLLAAELRACGVDLSFAPVVDLRSAASSVIGDRALHRDPEVVARLAQALMHGMREAGMSAVAKHFPGHGSVRGDSHHELPVDARDIETLRYADMLVFERMVHYGVLAMMPAHVVYPEVDPLPACFSRRWLRGVLRNQLGFTGAVFSDDLSMAGAASIGDLPERAVRALEAGCDMVLICNDRGAAESVLEVLGDGAADPLRAARLARLHGRGGEPSMDALARRSRHAQACRALAAISGAPEFDLDGG